MLTALMSKATIYAAGVALVLALLGGAYLYISHLRGEVASLTAAAAVQAQQIEQAQAVNAGNVAEIAKVRADAGAAVAAVAADRDAALARAATLSHAHQEVAHAAVQDRADCPVAPSVRAALDSLRRPAAAPARNPDPGSAAAGAGAATGLR